MSPNSNIVLIGMPGAGKSTVGVLLAKRLNFSFLDTDIYIQTHEGKSLQEIIRSHGLSGFCDLEENYVISIAVHTHVIAPGGSVVYRPKAMKHLASNGVLVHLNIELDWLKKRLRDMDARGVVIAPGQNLDDLYAERQPLYAKYADITVLTGKMTADQVVTEITQLLRMVE
jgi:shikimate kinase